MTHQSNKSPLFAESEVKYIQTLVKGSVSKYAPNSVIIDKIINYKNYASKDDFEFLFNQYVKLIISSARVYKNVATNIGDLINQSVEALYIAINSYNVNGEVKFITYFKSVLDGYLSDYMDVNQQAIKLPKNIRSRMGQIKGGLVSQAFNETVYTKSYIDSIYNPSNRHLFNKGEFMVDPESKIDTESLQFDILRVLDHLLDNRERDVIILLFGLDGNEPKSLNAISELMDGTPQLMGYIRDSALLKLSSNPNAKLILSKYR